MPKVIKDPYTPDTPAGLPIISGGDEPVSISFWYQATNTEDIFISIGQLGFTGVDDTIQLQLQVDASNQKAQVTIHDHQANNHPTNPTFDAGFGIVTTNSGVFTATQWYNIVFTYNGLGKIGPLGTDVDASSMKIFVNGVDATHTSAFSTGTGVPAYVRMRSVVPPDPPDAGFLGQIWIGRNPIDAGTPNYGEGTFGEVGFWNGYQLTANEVSAIYDTVVNGTSAGSYNLVTSFTANNGKVYSTTAASKCLYWIRTNGSTGAITSVGNSTQAVTVSTAPGRAYGLGPSYANQFGFTNFANGGSDYFHFPNTISLGKGPITFTPGTSAAVYRSGFISNPPRYLIRQFDSATGSYPTIARTGDVSRLGNYNVSFNDTNTVIFDDPYAKSEISFDMVFQTKVVPITTPGIYYGPINSNILGEGYKEIIVPTVNENFLSPQDGDKIKLTDSDGNFVEFTFRYGLNLSGLSSSEVQLPINKYNRKLLAKNFAEKINENSGIKIQATLLDEPKNRRLSGKNSFGLKEVYANGKIKLRQQKPGSAGNKAVTSTIAIPPPLVGKMEGLSIQNFTGGKNITVKYPVGLVKNYNSKAHRQSYATPNFIDDTLNNSGGVVRKGIGDSHIRFTKGEDLTSFNDSRIDIRDDIFYKEGTSDDIIPGFSSKLGDKTQITFDISSNREQHVFKQDGAIMNRLYAGGEFVNQDFTGFCYYNWDLGRWEQKGLNDPATGNSLSYQYGINADQSSGNLLLSASVNHVSQFTAPSGFSQLIVSEKNSGVEELEAANNYGYLRACSPHVAHCAPAGNLYHGTGSQTVKMSNYISTPFLVEKITIDIPVFARMSHAGHSNTVIVNGKTTPGITGNDRAEYSKDMMNHVFFLYHQQRNDQNTGLDSAASVSGSQRTLIASGAACFYNGSVYDRKNPGSFNNFEPFHTPAFKHKFAGGDFNGIQEFTGSIRVEMIPAVSPQLANPWNLYPLVVSGSTGTEVYGYLGNTPAAAAAQIPHFWYGGSNINPFNVGTDKLSGKDDVTKLSYFSTLYFKEWNDTFESNADDIPIRNLNNSRHGLVNTLGPIGSKRPTKDTALTYFKLANVGKDSTQSGISPFLLLPEDELILGVEKAGSEAAALLDIIGTFSDGNKKTFLPASISGSLLTIQQGQAQMTFYGSQVKQNVEFHDTLNQTLSSDAVHEVIHYDNPVIDQFQIEPRTTYVGSYLDDRNSQGFKISLRDPASRIGSSVSSLISTNFDGTTDSFTRYTQLHNFNQVFYDSMLPDITNAIKNETTPLSTTQSTFTFSYTGGYDNASPQNIVAYPFKLKTKDGSSAAFKSSTSTIVINEVDFLQYGVTTTHRGYLPLNFNLGFIGAASGVKASVRASAANQNVPLPYYNNALLADAYDNFKFSYRVYNYSNLTNDTLLVHPYKDNPERRLSNNDELTLLISEITNANIEGAGNSELTSVTVNPDGSFGASTSFRSELFNMIQPKVEYMSGQELAKVLLGGVENTLEASVSNNEQSPFATTLSNNPIPDGNDAAWGSGKLKNVTTNGLAVRGFSLTTNRGLSYGLINVNLQRNKMYMRSDRYTGQVADMIHSGYDTAFSNFVAKLSNGQLNLGRSRKINPIDPPVQVKFVEGSSSDPQNDTKGRKFKLVTPAELLNADINNQSSNISLFATSSLPYFDDEIPRNRSFADPTIVV